MSRIQDSWSVGQLATAAGVTVRTLHHYDQIDLLIASGRTASGHRRYSERDVKRLYEITAMRQLGLPLSEIRAVLDSDDDQLSDTVHRQLERVEAQLATTTRLRDQLTQLTRALHEGATPTVHEFINTTELTNMNVRIDRIMTKAGDTGDTSLADASRIPKNDPRLDAIGDVDELNANLGVVIDLSGTRPDVTETLLKIQNDLFDIGGDLAHPPDTEDTHQRISPDYTERLETEFVRINESLQPLETFVLPSGPPTTSQLGSVRCLV